MTPFLIIFIVLLIINVLFLILSMVFTHYYRKGEPPSVGSPRLSAASSMLNRQLNPRLSLQPQVTMFDLIRVSTGSSAYDAQMEPKRTSEPARASIQGPKDS